MHTESIDVYFWQNCISPHQIHYIKHMKSDVAINNVFLIVPEDISTERKLMGWESFEAKIAVNIIIIIAPDEREIDELYKRSSSNDVHLYSGIRGFKEVFLYFKKGLKFNIKRGIITEPPANYKIPLWIHKIKFFLLEYKYVKNIQYVFAIGEKAVKYYRFWSTKWNVFPFAYCVELRNECNFIDFKDALRFVFIGSLIERKNVIELLKQLPQSSEYTLDIIGDGEEKNKLEVFAKKRNLSDRVSFLGAMNMSDIHNKIQEYDVLVLPSKHDGWGAVINEGLQSGLYIITNMNCGASVLLSNSFLGFVYDNGHEFQKALGLCIRNKNDIRKNRRQRIQWSQKIEGLSIAKYMIQCIVDENRNITPPWL